MDGGTHPGTGNLDDAYANAPHIPGGAAYPDRWAATAAAFRASLGDRLKQAIPYGDGTRRTFDLMLPEHRPEGLVVFVHGGFWRAFDAGHWSHLAAGPLAQGQAVAMPSYPLSPEARISDITGAISKAIDAAAALVDGPVRLAGHSAGGHLVARAIMPDAAPACAARIAACVPISPLSDLRPLISLKMNDDWQLDLDEATRESPIFGRPLDGIATTVHVGAAERPAFLWQAHCLARSWTAPLVVEPGRHHFDVIDALADPASAMVRDLLA